MLSHKLLLAPALLATLAMGGLFTPVASARDHDRHDRWHFGIGFSSPNSYNNGDYAPGYGYANGYWVDRPEPVLVTPGHYETRYTQPVYQQGFDAYGNPVTYPVSPGYPTRVWVPPVYQTASAASGSPPRPRTTTTAAPTSH